MINPAPGENALVVLCALGRLGARSAPPVLIIVIVPLPPYVWLWDEARAFRITAIALSVTR